MFDIDREQQRADLCRSHELMEALDLSSERRPGEHPGENIHHQRQAVPFRASDRQQRSLERRTRIVSRHAGLIQRPSQRDLLAESLRLADLAAGHQAR